MINAIESYKKHLGAVYELPMFYGDETLRSLLNHTKDLSEDLEALKGFFEIEGSREGVSNEKTEIEE